MKRLLILFSAVLLAAAAVLTAALYLGSTQEQVTHQETVLSGDPAGADGLRLSLLYCGLREHPRWSTDYSFGEPDSSRTDFRFHTVVPTRSYPASEYRGVMLNTIGDNLTLEQLSDIFRQENRNGSGQTFSGLLGAYQQLYNETPEGELTNTYLRIGDYCAYYPLMGRLELASGGYHWNSYSSSGYADQRAELAEAFDAYFRIPVLEDDWIQVIVDKRESDAVMESVDVTESRKGSDVFRMYSVGVFFENTAYFTFGALTEQGNMVDTSLIPGGYGLYGYSCNSRGEAEPDSLATLCPLDPTFEPYDMTVDAENRNLLYFSVKDGNRYLTVISLDTMEILQTLCILDDLTSGWQFHKLPEGCLVAVSEEKGISVWEKDDRGQYVFRFTAPLEGGETAYELYDGAYAFDGQRLAVVQKKEVLEASSRAVCGFLVRVYTGSGCTYSGEYTPSLETDWLSARTSLKEVQVSWQ